MVSLQCEYAGGSSASEGGGNVFHRCYMDMAFPQYGSGRGHAGEQPTTHSHRITMCDLNGNIVLLSQFVIYCDILEEFI